jgi:sigma-B regulation protein RsbU (phosphoserine phosphatase)
VVCYGLTDSRRNYICDFSYLLANKVVSGLIHQEILAQELDVAHDMQMGLLSEDPNIAGLDVAGKCITANHVGGDYYNYLWLDEAHTRLAIVIADVAGHDMTAAIPAVMFSGMLEYAGREESPGAMLHTLNEALCRRLKHTPFITSCIGVIDLAHKMLVWSKAGHPEIYHYRRQKDDVVELVMDNYPLGMFRKSQYTDQTVALGVGDMLVFHTDGMAETCNEQGEVYGYDRVQESVLRRGREGVSSRETIARMVADARGFMGKQEQADDMTFVVVKITG